MGTTINAEHVSDNFNAQAQQPIAPQYRLVDYNFDKSSGTYEAVFSKATGGPGQARKPEVKDEKQTWAYMTMIQQEIDSETTDPNSARGKSLGQFKLGLIKIQQRKTRDGVPLDKPSVLDEKAHKPPSPHEP